MSWTVEEIFEYADHISESSRCNSTHRACILVREKVRGLEVVEFGYNDTVDPTCLAGVCHKRKLGEKHGESIFCRAMHAETMAAGKAMSKGLAADIALCNFSEMPCTMCLSNLHKAGVTKIWLQNDVIFYSYNDQLMWDHQYKGLMEVQAWPRPKASEADKQ